VESGKISKYKEAGYGWIALDRGGKIWFHANSSNIAKPVVGMKVTFTRGIDRLSGRQAAQLVRLLTEPAPASQTKNPRAGSSWGR
jgi:hypothetical protein